VATIAPALPVGSNFGVFSVYLSNPVNGEVMGGPLWYLPVAAPALPNATVVAKNSSAWNYHSTVTPAGWTTSTAWPPLDATSKVWSSLGFLESADWKLNRTAPFGWGNIGAATPYLTFGGSITERPVTVYFRKTFTVPSVSQASGLLIECMADDGAAVYINGSRVSPTSWGLNPGTNVGGALYYNQLSSRFRANDAAEGSYDSLTVNGSSLPTLFAGNNANVIAVEVHQNSVDSSDCAFDAAVTATYAVPPPPDSWAIVPNGAKLCIFWTNPGWILESSSGLNADWAPRPDLVSPVPLEAQLTRQFYRLRLP
jgi:hypothetical protein